MNPTQPTHNTITRRLATVFCLFLALLCSLQAHAADRVALVIGNGDYRGGLSYLNNPTKDAALMKQTLKKLGFRVIADSDNLNKEQLDNKLNEFARAARNAEVAFFYYAGHGSAHNGQNYLIPLAAGIDSATQLPYRAVNSQEVLARMTANAKTSVMVLDACRDTPFTKSATRGLAKMTADRGSYVIYAADDGQVAYDNRVFAKALARELLKPQSIQDVALSTRQAVLNATNDKQYPATYDKLRDKIYLNGKPNQVKPSQTPPPSTLPQQATNPAEIARKLQVQLNRLQCNAGKADGKWGSGSRAALQRLIHANSQLSRYGTQPSEALLQTIQNSSLQSCANVATTTASNQNNTSSQSGGKRIDHYIVYNNGTAKDTKTGLTWQRCTYGETWNGSGCSGTPKAMTWDEAMQFNKNGWRLPTIDELGTIVYCSSGQPEGIYPGRLAGSEACEGNYRRPTINTTVFPMNRSHFYGDGKEWWNANYWSSSPTAPNNDNGYAWGVDFHGGDDYYFYKNGSRYVRLVRGGL